MRRQILLIFTLALGFLSVVRVSNAQWASNPTGDLFGENLGEFIMIQWEAQDGAAEYRMYGSTSSSGPWTLLASRPDMKGGAKVHYTPDARLMDLCYKVEAADGSGAVIRVYQPICVPKYTG